MATRNGSRKRRRRCAIIAFPRAGIPSQNKPPSDIVEAPNIPFPAVKAEQSIINLRVHDCPGANGVEPEEGSVKYSVTFRLPDEVGLVVQFGQETFEQLRTSFKAHDDDDPGGGWRIVQPFLSNSLRLRFRADDCPGAGGVEMRGGDETFTMMLRLEGNKALVLSFGSDTFNQLKTAILSEDDPPDGPVSPEEDELMPDLKISLP